MVSVDVKHHVYLLTRAAATQSYVWVWVLRVWVSISMGIYGMANLFMIWISISGYVRAKICELSLFILYVQPMSLHDLLVVYTPSRQLRSSADTRILRLPHV